MREERLWPISRYDFDVWPEKMSQKGIDLSYNVCWSSGRRTGVPVLLNCRLFSSWPF